MKEKQLHASIDDLVDKEMEAVKVEVKENGKWVDGNNEL